MHIATFYEVIYYIRLLPNASTFSKYTGVKKLLKFDKVIMMLLLLT